MARTGEHQAVTLRGECEHRSVQHVPPARAGDLNEWVCSDCGTRFLPNLDYPVRPREDSRRGRLSGFQDW